MSKMKDSMYKKFSWKDIIVIVLALVAVIGLMLFLVYIQKKQQEEQNAMLEQSEEQQQDMQQELETEKAKVSIMINEVSLDGWVELYNSAEANVNLEGYTLLLNGQVVYTCTDTDLIEAKKLLAIDVSFQDLEADSSNVLSLQTADGDEVLKMKVPVLVQGESYGRVMDGQMEFSFLTPSKAMENTESKIITKSYPVFSVPGGFYEDEFRLSIQANEGMKIYYTLDGSTPTLESMEYTEPIKVANRTGEDNVLSAITDISNRVNYVPAEDVDKCTVLRAIAVDSDGTVSQVTTDTYIVGIYKNSLYNDMPILSIVTDAKNLFDYYEGIYVLGEVYENALAADLPVVGEANYYQQMTKDAYVQYFEPSRNLSFASNVTLGIQINYGTNLPQKSFEISQVESIVSKGSQIAKILPNEGENKLVLNNGRLDNYFKLREYMTIEMLKDLDIAKREIQPCIVFVNGEFWGLYTSTSDYSTTYISDMNGIKSDDILIATNGVVNKDSAQSEYDELYTFITTQDLAINSNYEKAEKLLDIQSYIDCYCANVYLASSEWPANQVTVWKTQVTNSGDNASIYEDGKWRFLLGSMDDSMALSDLNSFSINTFLRPQIEQDMFLYSLMRNENFRNQFQATMEKMGTNYFAYEKTNEFLLNTAKTYVKAAIATYNRFYGTATEDVYTSYVEKVDTFLLHRKEYMDVYLEEFINRERPMKLPEITVTEDIVDGVVEEEVPTN